MNRGATGTRLVIVTHGQIGRSLVDAAEFILGESLADVTFLSFRQSAEQATREEEITRALCGADPQRGVLVMTDIAGASPHNQVARLLPRDAALVSGVNLAMLIRAWNHRSQPPAQLARLAVEGAVREMRGGEA